VICRVAQSSRLRVQAPSRCEFQDWQRDAGQTRRRGRRRYNLSEPLLPILSPQKIRASSRRLPRVELLPLLAEPKAARSRTENFARNGRASRPCWKKCSENGKAGGPIGKLRQLTGNHGDLIGKLRELTGNRDQLIGKNDFPIGSRLFPLENFFFQQGFFNRFVPPEDRGSVFSGTAISAGAALSFTHRKSPFVRWPRMNETSRCRLNRFKSRRFKFLNSIRCGELNQLSSS
jgi:hypothetical protein